MQVKDYMRTQVRTVTPETLVSTAYQLMTLRGSRIRHLPVVTRENVLVGILTDRDVRWAAASDAPSMAEHELMYVLEKLRVRDIMTQDVATVHDTTPLVEAGQLLLQKKIGCLPVIRDDHRLKGILTVTDLLRAYVGQHNTGRAGSCKGEMQKQIITATPDMPLADVQRLVREHQIRHVPVVSGKRLVGIITDRDLREASPSPATTLTKGEIAYQLATTSVKQCMTKDVVWIGPDIDMVQAMDLLLQRKCGCLPVVDNGTLVGIITELDCLRVFLDSIRDV
jgi:acetoin utilization protein AcuB